MSMSLTKVSLFIILEKLFTLFALRHENEKICCVTSCKFDDKRETKPKLLAQSRPALYFSQQLPSTYIKGSTNIFVARQVDHARWKTRNVDPKPARKQCCATRWRILYLISPPLLSCGSLADRLLQLSFVLALLW